MHENDKALQATKSRAIRIMGSRQISAENMEKRLIEKGETEDNARSAVVWLEKIGAINDRQYAQDICSHYSNKGYGISRIRDELHKRGIPQEYWEEAFGVISEDAADDAVAVFLEKKLRGSSDKDSVRRAAEALCRRGFGYSDARQAVARYLESIENDE